MANTTKEFDLKSNINQNFHSVLNKAIQENDLSILEFIARNPDLLNNPEKGNIYISAIISLDNESTKKVISILLNNERKMLQYIPLDKIFVACNKGNEIIAISLLSKGTPSQIIGNIIKTHYNELILEPYIYGINNNSILMHMMNLLPLIGWDNEFSSKIFMTRLKNKPLDSFITNVAKQHVNVEMASALINASNNINNVTLKKNVAYNNTLTMQIVKGLTADNKSPSQLMSSIDSLILAIKNNEISENFINEIITEIINKLLDWKTFDSVTMNKRVTIHLFTMMPAIISKTNDTINKQLLQLFKNNVDWLSNNEQLTADIVHSFLHNKATEKTLIESFPLDFFKNILLYDEDRKLIYQKLNEPFETIETPEAPETRTEEKTSTETIFPEELLKDLDKQIESLKQEEKKRISNIIKGLLKKSNNNWYIKSKSEDMIKEAGILNKTAIAMMMAVILVLMGSTINNAIAKVKHNKDIDLQVEEVQRALQDPYIKNKAQEIIKQRTPAEIEQQLEKDKIEQNKQNQQEKTQPKIRKWQENIIARTLYAEAKSESKDGLMAVASVIFNRSDKTPEGIISAIQKPFHFSCWNGASKQDWTSMKEFEGPIWDECKRIANLMVSGNFNPTIEYDHYYNPQKANPSWAYLDKNKMQHRPYITIGNHRFLKAKELFGLFKV